jgi:hypothetical protein
VRPAVAATDPRQLLEGDRVQVSQRHLDVAIHDLVDVELIADLEVAPNKALVGLAKYRRSSTRRCMVISQASRTWRFAAIPVLLVETILGASSR